MGNASAAAGLEAGFRERRGLQHRRLDEAVQRVAPIGVEAIEREASADEPDRGIRFSLGRGERAIQIGGRGAADGVADEDALLGSGLGRQHLAAIERAVGDAQEVASARARERVVGGVVPVRPDAELRIVVKIGVRVIVPRPLTDRIAAARDRDADVIGALRLVGVRELRDQPPVGERIVEDDAIAVAALFARAPEAREERPGGDRSEQRPSVLAENREAGVHDLHVVRRAYVALRIRRNSVDLERPGIHAEKAEPDPVEVGGGPRQQERRDAPLEHRVLPWRRCLGLVGNAAGSMLDFPLVLRRRRDEQRERRRDVAAVRVQDMSARRLGRRQARHGDEAQQQGGCQAHSVR